MNAELREMCYSVMAAAKFMDEDPRAVAVSDQIQATLRDQDFFGVHLSDTRQADTSMRLLFGMAMFASELEGGLETEEIEAVAKELGMERWQVYYFTLRMMMLILANSSARALLAAEEVKK